MRLSKRLKAVADMVHESDGLVDVGTDHAYIPIYLCSRGEMSHSIASDVREGPLGAARENIDKYGMSDKISTRLGDGLVNISASECRSIVIAGMGGALIKKILSESDSVCRNVSEIIAQPQSEPELVRKFFYDNSFIIEDEDAVFDAGKYYFVMRAVPAEGCFSSERAGLSMEQLKYGQILLSRKHPVLYEYLLKERKKYFRISNTLSEQFSMRHSERIDEIKKEMQYIDAAIKYYEV